MPIGFGNRVGHLLAPSRQELGPDHIDFAATHSAPHSRASAPPDGKNLLGLDGDLNPLMCRASLHRTFTELASRATVQPEPVRQGLLLDNMRALCRKLGSEVFSAASKFLRIY